MDTHFIFQWVKTGKQLSTKTLIEEPYFVPYLAANKSQKPSQDWGEG
jgi:hypothetical protein